MKLSKFTQLSHLARYDKTKLPIYPAKAKGKIVPLLKTLVSSDCQNDCKFCVNRYSRKCPRVSTEPEQMANFALKLHEKGLIEGVFLSSALSKDPDYDSMREVETVRILRKKGFTGYTHLRLMPGCSLDTIKRASQVADRVGINLEAPNSELYNELKVSEVFSYKQGILKRMRWIAREYRKLNNSKRVGNLRAGIDTQFIVGATQDSDKDFLRATNWLYDELDLRRVYYSGFRPIPKTPLEDQQPCSKEREYRLYQASFLLRDYNFSYKDLTYDENRNLIDQDPKLAFAQHHPEFYPINLDSASYDQLLLIPGIGPSTAKKIIQHRPFDSLTELRRITGSRLRRSLKYLKIPNMITLRRFGG